MELFNDVSEVFEQSCDLYLKVVLLLQEQAGLSTSAMLISIIAVSIREILDLCPDNIIE